jgi:PPIC-type PPIASE domain
MRLYVTAVVLSCVSGALAQTQVVNTPVQRSTVMPQSPIQRTPIRQAGLPGTAAGQANTAEVTPTTPVVTLDGVCSNPQAKGPCKTVITREDLDRYAKTFSPDPSGAARGRMATQYAKALVFSALAERQGLEKSPTLAKEIEAQLKLVRMHILASAYMQSEQAQMPGVTDGEIERYYEVHKDEYEQVQVSRLSVPIAVPTEDGRPLDRAAVKSVMDELRSRAIAGEDLNLLQQDAYKQLHIQATPPSVKPMLVQRRSVQGDETKVFDLKPGEISTVLDLPAAFAILKLESKEPIPMIAVRQEVEAALRATRIQKQLGKLSKKINAQFNLEYLGMPSQPDLFGQAETKPALTWSRRVRKGSGARP